jgi:hypothetical protein
MATLTRSVEKRITKCSVLMYANAHVPWRLIMKDTKVVAFRGKRCNLETGKTCSRPGTDEKCICVLVGRKWKGEITEKTKA